MNNDQSLLSEFQERNMGGVHHINMFVTREGKHLPLGVVRNEFNDVTSAWYLHDNKRNFLTIQRLVHIETLRATINGGPCYLWSYPELVPRFRVLLDLQKAPSRAVFDGYVYALTSEKAVAKARFRLSRSESIPIENVTTWLNDNPANATTSRIDYRT